MDEIELLTLAKSGDEKAISAVIEKYKPLVTLIARKYFLVNAEQEELVQEGMIGLFKACRSFNVSSSVPFKTYAGICIRRQIQSALVANNRLKNLPINTYLSINNQGKVLVSDMAFDEKDFDEDEQGFYVEAKNLNPEESVLFREKLKEICDKINDTLSSFEKKVLHLFVSGRNYVEISNILLKEPKSIDNALTRIKIKLKDIKGRE